MGNGALYRGVLRETLEEVGLADKLDQYEKHIRELVKKILDVDKVWNKQPPQRIQQLENRLRKLFPTTLEYTCRTQARLLAYARAQLTALRSRHLKRQRENLTRPMTLNQGKSSTTIKPILVPDRGGKVLCKREPKLGEYESGSCVLGKSLVRTSTLQKRPHVSRAPVGTLFSTSRHLQRLIKSSPDSGQGFGEAGSSFANASPVEPQSVSKPFRIEKSRLRSDVFSNAATACSDKSVVVFNDIDKPGTQMKGGYDNSGTTDVKAFLEGCVPSMAHHFTSFVKAGIRNGAYLRALTLLCASDTEALQSILGPDLTRMDAALLRHHLFLWSEDT